MPSPFVVECADMLVETQDPDRVLAHMRERSRPSSLPKQITAVRECVYDRQVRPPEYARLDDLAIEVMANVHLVGKEVLDRLVYFFRADVREQMKIVQSGFVTGNSVVDSNVLKIPLVPHYLTDFKASSEDHATIRQSRPEKMPRKITFSSISLKPDDDPFRTTALVTLTSGLRVADMFGGDMNKVKGQKFAFEWKGHVYPLLVPFPRFAAMMNTARSTLGSQANANRNYSHRLGTAAKELLGSLMATFNDLRDAYCVISYLSFENEWPPDGWAKHVVKRPQMPTHVRVEGNVKRLGKWE